MEEKLYYVHIFLFLNKLFINEYTRIKAIIGSKD